MSRDITFCGYRDCPNKECDRHTSQIKNKDELHSFAYFTECWRFKYTEKSQKRTRL